MCFGATIRSFFLPPIMQIQRRISLVLASSLVLSSLGQSALAASVTLAAETNYSSAIEYIMERGILPVRSDGLFHPEEELSRLDLLLAIVRDVYAADVSERCFDNIAPEIPARFTHLFTDVPRSAGYAKEVCVGMFVGILNGQKDGSLKPFWSANLAEAAKVISKAYGIAPFLGLYPKPEIPWHEPYWYALARRDAIPESIRMQRNHRLTRGEFAEILFRLRSDRPLVGARHLPMHVSAKAMFASADAPNEDVPVVSVKGGSVSLGEAALFSRKPGPVGAAILARVEERRMERLSRLSQNISAMSSEHLQRRTAASET